MDNLTIAIIAAVVSAVATFLLTKASTIAKVVSGSRSIRWTARKFRNLRDGYGVKRTRKVVRNWFGTNKGIRRLSIEDYERATRTRERGRPAVQLFSFMNLKQPSFAPKLDDHYIAAAIENLCKKGTLAKISEAQLGGGYSHTRGQPAEPKNQSILYFGGSPSEARRKEAEGEEERRCIECHFWPVTDECPKTRYSFYPVEEEKEARTWYGIKPVEDDQAGTCQRCWEK